MVYLLGIVETCRVLLILQLSWLHVVLKSAEVVLAKLLLGMRLKTFVERGLLTLVILGVDGGASCFGEGLGK